MVDAESVAVRPHAEPGELAGIRVRRAPGVDPDPYRTARRLAGGVERGARLSRYGRPLFQSPSRTAGSPMRLSAYAGFVAPEADLGPLQWEVGAADEDVADPASSKRCRFRSVQERLARFSRRAVRYAMADCARVCGVSLSAVRQCSRPTPRRESRTTWVWPVG